jgi:hypothetical protein
MGNEALNRHKKFRFDLRFTDIFVEHSPGPLWRKIIRCDACVLLVVSVYGDQLRIIMASSRVWANSQQQEMSDFDSADNFPSGEGFNIGELSGMDGTCDLVLYVYCSKRRNYSSVRPLLLFVC